VRKAAAYTVVLIALLTAMPGGAQETAPPGADETQVSLPPVVARIDDEEVTAQEFLNAVRLTQARQRMREDVPDNFVLSPEERMRVLQLLIESKALRMLARDAQLEVPEEDIDAHIAQEMERAGGEEAFAAVLERGGMDSDDYRNLVEE
jgi:hypothetical protein